MRRLQQSDGSFFGDETGEVDTRFSYCALACLKIINRMDAVDLAGAVDFIKRCKNFDGGYGSVPGNESHAGQVFTCVAALKLADALDTIDSDLLCWWYASLNPLILYYHSSLKHPYNVQLFRLAERQTASGGLNGRPEKLQDVCYSWWCLSALSILGKLHWIDQDKLKDFILDCQDEIDGGISDRPEDQVDIYHTFFGIAGLSLMGHPGLKSIDPTLALPSEVVEQLHLSL